MWGIGGENVSLADVALMQKAFPNIRGPMNSYGGFPRGADGLVCWWVLGIGLVGAGLVGPGFEMCGTVVLV
jgi:hypothetical protein